MSVEAVISEEPEFIHENGRWYAVARLKRISGKKAYGKIRLSFSESRDALDAESMKTGDKISFNATVYKIGQASADVHKYYSSTGIYTGGSNIKNLSVQKPLYRPVSYYVSLVRGYLIDTVSHSFDNKTAGVIIAILTGDKSYTDNDTYAKFRLSGAAHIMAVSGMHLSVWVLFFSFLLDKFKKHKLIKSVLLSSVVLFVMFLSCFSASVMRAGVMVLLHLTGKLIGRKSDGINSLGFASIVLLCFNSYTAINVGFQLSFMSVASIYILAFPVIEYIEGRLLHKIPTEPMKKLFSAVASSLCISLSVTLFTFPITVMAFGGISLVSPFTNLLLLPSATPLMVLSGIYVALSFVPAVSTVLKLIVKLTADYTIGVVEFSAGLSGAYLSVNSRHIIIWMIFAFLIIFSLFMLIKKRLVLSKISFSAVIIAFIFAMFNQLSTSLGQYKITPVLSENASAYIISMNGRGVLAGVGTDYYFESALADTVERLGVSLDAVVCRDEKEIHEAGYICAGYDIDYVIDDTGEAVVLFGQVRIENAEDYISVCGNGISAGIFQKDYLQSHNSCDIILNKYGVLFPNEEGIPEEYAYYSEETADLTVVVNENGEYSFGG
ncbi:MAG: ComEC/Rec2 family competence protein [Clostridia bacterium]|nr:ComEC/Rec2 family competence protein [Clostridia bacterium]